VPGGIAGPPCLRRPQIRRPGPPGWGLGRPSTARTNETVGRVNAVIRGNRRLAIRKIADEFNLSFGTFQAILTQDLGMYLQYRIY
jgi:hypothetical protein